MSPCCRNATVPFMVKRITPLPRSSLGWGGPPTVDSGMSADTIASSTQKDGSSLTSAAGLVQGPQGSDVYLMQTSQGEAPTKSIWDEICPDTHCPPYPGGKSVLWLYGWDERQWP